VLESICANDKKAVYQLIVKSDVDVNAIGWQALSGMSSCSEVSTPAKLLLWKKQEVIRCCAGDSFNMASSNLNIASQSENHILEDVKDGTSVLHLACLTSDIGMVELLLQLGADINASDSVGRTPLHCCIIRGKTAAAKALILR